MCLTDLEVTLKNTSSFNSFFAAQTLAAFCELSFNSHSWAFLLTQQQHSIPFYLTFTCCVFSPNRQHRRHILCFHLLYAGQLGIMKTQSKVARDRLLFLLSQRQMNLSFFKGCWPVCPTAWHPYLLCHLCYKQKNCISPWAEQQAGSVFFFLLC